MNKRPVTAALLIAAGFALAVSANGHAGRRAEPGRVADRVSLPARHLALVGDRRYTMHAGVRPLLVFWIRRDNVGSARVQFREGPNGARGWEMTVGSDPNRAPRRINRWGYLSEEKNAAGILLLGVMKASDEESLEEAKGSIERERQAGGFVYKAIRSEVTGDSGRTAISHVSVDQDLSYRELEQLLPLVSADDAAQRAFRLPPGVRGGYLGTIAEIVNASVAWHRSGRTGPRIEGRGFKYLYNANPYEMTLTESKHRASATFKGHDFKEIVEGQFSVTNQKTGGKTDFRLDFGTAGDLAGIPVHVVWKPKWWLEVELVLDQAGVY